MTFLPHIASRIYGRPLLLHPATAALLTDALGERFGAALSADLAALVPEASRFRGRPSEVGAGYKVENGRALITITGELCNRGAWIGASSGLTSYEGLSAQVRAAVADPAVSAIVLDLNTPGGEAVGCFEAAAEIRAAAQRKPVTSFVNGMAASAGYALASAANRIIVTPSAVVGSIGVVMLHVDRSRQLDRQGLAPTFIFAGSHKVDGHGFAPLPDSVKADIQREVDGFYDMFVDTVARNRGLPAATVRATEARMYMGAEAVKAGLADATGTLDDALAAKPTGLPAPRTAPIGLSAAAPHALPTASVPSGPEATMATSAPMRQAVAPPPSAADIRASAIGVAADLWREKGRAATAAMGFPDDVMQAAGQIVQAEHTAAWDGAAANVRHEDGLVPRPGAGAGRPADPAGNSASDDLWGDVTAKVNAQHGFPPGDPAMPADESRHQSPSAALWDEAAAKVAGENGLMPTARAGHSALAASSAQEASAGDPWGQAVAKVNVEQAAAPSVTSSDVKRRAVATAGTWADAVASINAENAIA